MDTTSNGMNIGLLIHPYSKTAPGGLGRANAMLSQAMLGLDTENSYTLYIKGDEQQPLPSGPSFTTKILGKGAIWLTGAFSLDKTLDAYVFFTPIIPLFFKPKKAIVVALDFAFLEIAPRNIQEQLTTWVLYQLQKRSFRIADKIITISQATKDSAIRHFGISPEKIEVVHIGYMPLTNTFEPIEVPEKFVLFAGVLKERKNVLGVIRAFALFHTAHPDFSLIIAGKADGAYYQSLLALVLELGVGESVRFVGYVKDAELAYLYSKAAALVFPSLLEGFGMPVLEAMQVGLPVVTSNDGSLAEIAGNAAELVDPRSPDDIALGIAHVVDDPALRAGLIERGHIRAGEFSWERAGARLLEAIRTLS